MIIDINKINNIIELKVKVLNKKYDFIIIGSGPAAISLYKEILKKKKYKILIIEKGGLKNNNFEQVISQNLPIKQNSRAFSVGGTSNLWKNTSSYFESFEMKSRWLNNSKNLWPISHNNLTKLYKKINKLYGFSYSKLKTIEIDTPFNLRNFIGKNIPVKFKKFIKKNEIDLIYNCEVQTLDEYKNNTYINFRFNKEIKKIFAKKIILCCGGIDSTALILKSLKNDKLKNIKNKKMVGCNFMEHPKLTLGFIRYPKKNLINKLELKYNKKNFSYFGVSMSENTQNIKKILNSYIRFEKTYFDFEIKKESILTFELLRYLYVIIFGNKKKIFYKVRLFTEMSPNLNNKILIDKKTQKILVNYKFSKIDLNTIKILSSSVFKFFSIRPELERINPISLKKLKDSSHHMGGLCYTSNINKTVVDKNLRIMGTKNIFVCSSAIFPTSGSVNPTMTICALAIRLGNYLVNQIK